MKKFKNTHLLSFAIFALVFILFAWKLDRYYFYTDEILYAHRGLEHFQGIYSATLQVPPLPKYFAGLAYTLANGNLGFMRLPYALLGTFTAYLLYLIL